MQDTNKSSAIKEMQKGLDENNDGKVGFQEYLNLIGYVANSLSESQHPQWESLCLQGERIVDAPASMGSSDQPSFTLKHSTYNLHLVRVRRP